MIHAGILTAVSGSAPTISRSSCFWLLPGIGSIENRMRVCSIGHKTAMTSPNDLVSANPFFIPPIIKRIQRTVYCTQLAFLKKSFIITGMAQTTTELNTLLAAVDEAIAKLMSGERVTRISNGERMAEYGQAKLGELQDYKSSLVAEINALNSKPRHFRISTSKGV
jgi:hypothetical protein